MNPTKILAVCKFSKLEYDQIKYNLSSSDLIKKYEREGIEYDVIIESHTEQKMCIDLARNLLPEACFIRTTDLKKEHTVDKDLIISLGGDEHLKYVIHNSVHDKLILSVRSDNLKSEGALSTCNRFNLEEMVKQIRSNNYIIAQWTKIEAYLNDKPIEKSADTIFIGEKNPTRMTRYFLYYNDEIEEQKSSGLIVVTGTGSTGWFKSCGGKPFSRIAKIGRFIAREIYIGTKTGNDLRIGEFAPNEQLEIHSLMENGIVEIDSIKEHPFKRGDKLVIRVSDEALKMVLLNSDHQ